MAPESNEVTAPDNDVEMAPESNEVTVPDNGSGTTTAKSSNEDADKGGNKPAATQEEPAKAPASTTDAGKETDAQQPAEDTGIYFDDGFGQQGGANTTKQTKEKEPRQENFDLEDEYYDLEGF